MIAASREAAFEHTPGTIVKTDEDSQPENVEPPDSGGCKCVRGGT